MKKLTARQQKFLEELPCSNSLAEAARRAGYSEKFAGQAGYLALQRIGKKAPELFEDCAQSLANLIETDIKPALAATKTIYFTYKGEVKDKREVPDSLTRLKMIELCLKIHGAFAK